jgi:putative nucleotidyltransferase with HDIG domain
MEREQALALIKEKVKNKNLVKHMLATEACMGALAEFLNEDKKLWQLAGLLHDVDYDETVNNSSQHGLISAKILEELKVDERIIHAIKAHAGHAERNTKLDIALYAVDPLTGLIVASSLMHPTKSLGKVNTQFVLNRFKEKRFAAGANREQIKTCSELGLSLEKFIEICLNAMQSISKELEL